jgi:membrane protein YdbS with pleckstrin-like domain
VADKSEVIVPRSWLSELRLLSLYAITGWLSIYFSSLIPLSIIRGEILRLGNLQIFLSLPLFFFIPFGIISVALFRLYNVRYSLNANGVEARIGVLWTSQQVVRVRYEDIVGVEARQTLLQRTLGIGDLELASAATAGTEIILVGIGSPFAVLQTIQDARNS